MHYNKNRKWSQVEPALWRFRKVLMLPEGRSSFIALVNPTEQLYLNITLSVYLQP